MPPTETALRGTRRAWIVVVSILSLITLLIVASCGGLMEYFGVPVSGSEFNPTTYEVRSFVYRVSPFTGRQTSGISRSVQMTPLGEMLNQGKWLPAAPDQNRWDLITDSTVPRSSDWLAADWGKLVQDVSLSQAWEAWNQKYPQAAAVIWPAVIELGRESCYGEIVPLLEAVTPKPPRLNDLVREIDRRLAERYRTAADESSDAELAKHYRTLAEQPFSQRHPAGSPESDDSKEPANTDASEPASSEPMADVPGESN